MPNNKLINIFFLSKLAIMYLLFNYVLYVTCSTTSHNKIKNY